MTDKVKKIKEALSKAKKPGTLAGLKSQDVMTVLESMKASISMALPKHLTADRMLSMATTVISSNPKLAECTAQSLIGAVMQASILGFKPTPILGECYFVPFNNKKTLPNGREVWQKEVQMQIGYKGYISLARRSGEIKTLYAYPVYENDEFTYELGLEPKLEHKPADGDRGKFTHVYAVAHYKDDGYNFMVLTKGEVEKLRLRNKSQKAKPSGAWATDYETMACAKAIKQLAKYMPLSDEMNKAVISDEAIITDKAFTNDHEGIDIEKVEYADFESMEQPEEQEPQEDIPKHVPKEEEATDPQKEPSDGLFKDGGTK